MSFARRISSLALVIAPVGTAGRAIGPVGRPSRPEVEFAEPFDQVTAVRELSDGRVIVADLLAKAVSLTDLRLVPFAVGTDADSLFGAIALATTGGTIAGTIGAMFVVPAMVGGGR